MRKPLQYKYINLLFRIIIGFAAVWFIVVKLRNGFIEDINQVNFNLGLILLTVLLLFVNWGIEAVKWRFAIRKIESITFFKAIKLTFTGITVGLLTPNRVGEIPVRALLLNRKLFKEITMKTVVSSFSQVIITFLFGGVGLMFVQQNFDFRISDSLLDSIILIGLGILLFLYFKVSKLTYLFQKIRFLRNQELIGALRDFSFIELFSLLVFSFFRYSVFFFQYWLMLKAFGIELVGIKEILLIPVCFLIASSIPTILISEIGVRGSVALFVFGVVSDFDIQIVLASVLLWLINVAIPALLGLFNLKDLKLLKDR